MQVKQHWRKLAHRINAEVERISAVTSGVKEIRESIERAKQNRLADRQTILFVDEVHRFNKSQQDAFYPILKMVRLFYWSDNGKSFEIK